MVDGKSSCVSTDALSSLQSFVLQSKLFIQVFSSSVAFQYIIPRLLEIWISLTLNDLSENSYGMAEYCQM